jgi:CRISPR-associated protein Csd1
VDYADTRMELPPTMYGKMPVRWLVDLDPDGKLEGFVPLGGDTKANRRGRNLLVPRVDRTSGVRPNLLADNGEYVLGVGKPDASPEKVRDRHRSFVELVRLCSEETKEQAIGAVVRFLDSWSPDAAAFPEDFDAGLNVTFRVGGAIPAEDLESVQEFWAAYTSRDGGSSPIMTCLVTGEVGPVESTLPGNIKGIPDGQTSGTYLVSANKKAFTSYGLEGAPISKLAGERFNKALNDLMLNQESRLRIGPLAYVFWTRKESSFGLGIISNPEPESVKRLLDSPRVGRREVGVDPEAFYVLALSASGARAVVRDWLETTVPEAEGNLKRWFEAQRIVNVYGETGPDHARPLGVYALAASTYRDRDAANKEMTPQVPAALVRTALRGGRLPEDLLARAVRRNLTGTVMPNGNREKVTYGRAALIKLWLTYNEGGDLEQVKEALDAGHPEPAYHCGRLLAELEALQVAAIPGVKATLVDRYYGSASSTPAVVFGTLMSGARSHISKLRKGPQGGAGAAIQERIEEITTRVGSEFPRTLTLRQQAIFALGYYHQRAHDRARRSEARAAREARERGEEG